MNARELAALLQVHPNTIYNMIKSGEIIAQKSGRSFIIENDEVERILQAHSGPPVEGWERRFDRTNVQVVCRACHEAAHVRGVRNI